MKRYRVRVLPLAKEHIERLFGHVLDRELASPTGSPQVAVDATEALRVAFDALSITPFTCGKASEDPPCRELVIPFGRTGYIALFKIHGDEVLIARVRHQLEDDCL